MKRLVNELGVIAIATIFLLSLLRGNAKNAVLEVIPEHIVYVESMANYTDICYLEDDCWRHHSLRITMKQLRECLSAV